MKHAQWSYIIWSVFLLSSSSYLASTHRTHLRNSTLVNICKDIMQNAADCQITYMGWQLLRNCIRGRTISISQLQSHIECLNQTVCLNQDRSGLAQPAFNRHGPATVEPSRQPSPVDTSAPAHLPTPTSVSLPDPRGNISASDAANNTDAADGHDSNLDDFTYTADDGSQAMATRGTGGEHMAHAEMLAAACLLVVAVVAVTGFCMVRARRRALAAEEEEEPETEDAERDAPEREAGGEQEAADGGNIAGESAEQGELVAEQEQPPEETEATV